MRDLSLIFFVNKVHKQKIQFCEFDYRCYRAWALAGVLGSKVLNFVL